MNGTFDLNDYVVLDKKKFTHSIAGLQILQKHIGMSAQNNNNPFEKLVFTCLTETIDELISEAIINSTQGAEKNG